MSSVKISLIGAGNIGGTIAHILAKSSLATEIVLLDINANTAKAKALDISQSSGVCGFTTKLIGTGDYAAISGSNVIVVTAGIPRKPGMSRDDLLKTNAKIISDIALQLKQYAPNAFVVVVTNPLDAMVQLMAKVSGLPTKKVVGMAGVLDSARFTFFLYERLNVRASDISTIVLGGHGDTMVPLMKHTTIAGVPLESFIKRGLITQADINAIIQRTRDGGAEIVSLFGNGSAFYSPAESVCKMVEAFLLNKKSTLPCAAMLNGEYGVTGTYVGVPCVIGKDGVESVVILDLSHEELTMFNKSVESVRDLVAATA